MLSVKVKGTATVLCFFLGALGGSSFFRLAKAAWVLFGFDCRSFRLEYSYSFFMIICASFKGKDGAVIK